MTPTPPRPPDPPPLAELARVSLKVGLLGFGGPAGQIALMQRLYVDTRRWIAPEQLARGLGLCALLPGPEAMQLAVWIGWQLRGVRGGLVCGALFVLPGAVVVLALSWLYAAGGQSGWLAGAFLGAACAVIPLMVEGLVRLGRRALGRVAACAIAAVAALGLGTGFAGFPVLVALAALAGALLLRSAPADTPVPGPAAAPRGAWRAALVTGLAWLAPVALLVLGLGPDHVLAGIATAMSTLALVSFGGAYALLGWLTQVAVDTHGWLTREQMLAGMALSETTPGPAVLVTQYVGFMAGWREGGPALALAGALVASWCIFVPAAAWVFLAGPVADRLAARPAVAGALAGIQAAVAGILAALVAGFAGALLFAAHTPLAFGPVRAAVPDIATLDADRLAIVALAAVATWRGAAHVWIVAGAALAGALLLASG